MSKTTTIPLSQWMLSKWASVEAAGETVKKRVSTWPKQVEDVIKGEFNTEAKSLGQDKAYHQNSVVVAYLLVQHIMRAAPPMEGYGNNAFAKLNIDPNSINVTISVEDSCSLDSVDAGFKPGTEQLRSIFYSLGEVLLMLFSRQETITPECQTTLLSRQESLNERREDANRESDTFDSFQDTMQRALLFFDLEEGGGDTMVDDLYELPEKRGRAVTPSTFSIICANYPRLPMSLCRLVADVMEGTNGGLALTKTSFTSLEEISDDLKRMMFEPDVFLHNPCDPKIDFGSRMYGREKEISAILSVAEGISSQQGSGALEIICVYGYSGSGKSFLVNQIGRYLSAKGWIFLEAKFDTMRQSDAALSAMMSAFENYFLAMESMKYSGGSDELSYCNNVATKIVEAIGSDGVNSLSRVIPSLNKLGGNGACDSRDGSIVRAGEESAIYDQRIEYLLCALVEAILSVGRPILLLYDSNTGLVKSQCLQRMLRHIADRTSSGKHLLFVECCGKKEAEGLDTSLIAAHDAVNVSKIDIEELSKPALNEAISYALRLPPRVTAPLSEIIHIKTMGNILFVIEFMKSLEKSKMLTYNLSERQWAWDTDIVPLQRISDSVADLLMNKLLNLDKSVLDCLIIASCFGSQINIPIMELLNGLRGVTNITANLDIGVREGILEKAGPLYMFSHSSLQHTVYEVTPKHCRSQLHLDIGSTLISKSANAPQEVIEELFSVALSHINKSLPNDTNGQSNEISLSSSQRAVFAKLNLKAGQKAISNSADFDLAKFHFHSGVSFLPEQCWHNQYDLAFTLHIEYAKVLLVQREYEELDFRCKALLLKARCIEDQIKIHELLIAYLFRSGKFPEALEHVRSVLDTLGFPLPTTVDADTVRTVLEALRNAAAGFTPEQMQTFPLMTEEVPKQAMTIMGSVPILLTFSSPTFAAMIACQMTQLSIQHGLCAESAVAFANLGFAINSVLNDYSCGYDMGNLGLAIFQRFKSNALILKTYLPIYGFLKSWKEPLQTCSEGLSFAIQEGSRAGDLGSVFTAKVVLNRHLLINGCKLTELRMKQESLCREMMFDKQEKKFGAFFYQSLGDLYAILSLTGEPDDQVASMFVSRQECEKEMLHIYSATKNTSVLQLFYYHRLLQAFAAKDYEAALKYSDEYDKVGTGMISRITDVVSVFLSGVIGFAMARKTNQAAMFEIGERRRMQLQLWSDHGSRWNAENKALLLQAEKCYTQGSFDEAKSFYEASAKSAKEHKFIHDEALAYELNGNFHIETGDLENGKELLKKAQSTYVEWGAMKIASDVLPLM